VALCALESFPQVVALLKLARKKLGGELTAFEVMWNEYYKNVIDRVKGVAAPLPTNHPFYVLFEASGSDADRLHADHEKLLEEAMNEGLLIDATISTSRASAAAIWRIRDSSVELGRTYGVGARVGLDVSLAVDRMEDYALTVRSRIKEIDPNAFAVILGHVGDGNLHVSVYHDETPDKHEDMERLLYGMIRDYDGSVSAEHGIGILKRPYLKLSRTEAELETMRMLKRTLDQNNILNRGRVFVLGDNT